VCACVCVCVCVCVYLFACVSVFVCVIVCACSSRKAPSRSPEKAATRRFCFDCLDEDLYRRRRSPSHTSTGATSTMLQQKKQENPESSTKSPAASKIYTFGLNRGSVLGSLSPNSWSRFERSFFSKSIRPCVTPQFKIAPNRELDIAEERRDFLYRPLLYRLLCCLQGSLSRQAILCYLLRCSWRTNRMLSRRFVWVQRERHKSESGLKGHIPSIQVLVCKQRTTSTRAKGINIW
jgi:hypothetical protein